ncbi:gas vesicle protein [Nocardioides sp. YIM 152315]|uniref:gas vesicle protein GvpO n=1 Tax=Nocardioides sp. YIM 152315 TaxID=3031760 RepID=UPI0023DB5567|nr:gas vesicle protein [Nocardioides sp. YIM 152315]MDF1602515.1 gas vesicle protein [Nocardioides sp. YIM 152315]
MAETTRSARPGGDGSRKAPAKETARKTAKTTPKKTPKTAAKKTAGKKTAGKKTAGKTAKAAPKASARPRPRGGSDSGPPRGGQVALLGAQQLVELTGKELEGVVGISRDEDGWTIQVEVLEMRRIPNTTDVLAVYDVTVDRAGDLVGYRRADRYVRGSAREEPR